MELGTVKKREIKTRLFGYDLLKAIAILMIVFYHMHMLDFGFQQGAHYVPNVNKAIQIICAAGVPLFFMVNGVFTIGKITHFKKLLSKVGRLLFVAIFWTIVFKILFEGLLLDKGVEEKLSDFCNYYWFFYSLAIIYVVNYLIDLAPKLFGHILIGFVFSVTFVNNFVWDIILFIEPNHVLPSWGHMGLFTLYGIVYTRLGAFLRDRKINTTVCVLMVVSGYLLVLFETIVMTNATSTLSDGVNSSFPTIGALLMSCGLFCVLKDTEDQKNALSKLICLVGMNTVGVYVFHQALVLVIRSLFFINILEIEKLPLVLVLLLAIIICMICAFLSSKISNSSCGVLLKL